MTYNPPYYAELLEACGFRKAKDLFAFERSAKVPAPERFIRVADKISNLRSIMNDPPIDWTPERQREYVRWAKAVIDRLTSPPPSLKEEFDWTYRRLMGE